MKAMKTDYKYWGDYIHQKRIDNDITLREFCRSYGIDPSNWSKVERGIANPPKDRVLLMQVMRDLGILHNDEERLRFWMLYNHSFLEFRTESVLDKLPVILSGKNEAQLRSLFELIKNS